MMPDTSSSHNKHDQNIERMSWQNTKYLTTSGKRPVSTRVAISQSNLHFISRRACIMHSIHKTPCFFYLNPDRLQNFISRGASLRQILERSYEIPFQEVTSQSIVQQPASWKDWDKSHRLTRRSGNGTLWKAGVWNLNEYMLTCFLMSIASYELKM